MFHVFCKCSEPRYLASDCTPTHAILKLPTTAPSGSPFAETSGKFLVQCARCNNYTRVTVQAGQIVSPAYDVAENPSAVLSLEDRLDRLEENMDHLWHKLQGGRKMLVG